MAVLRWRGARKRWNDLFFMQFYKWKAKVFCFWSKSCVLPFLFF